MLGKKIELWLHTPILIFTDNHSRAAHGLRGEILDTPAGAFVIKVVEFLGERAEKLEISGRELLLPFHKIDHLFFA